ncbi:MAG: hypothetical protein Q8R86_08555 [Sulfuricurvum sp.]|nr:hypothetical protein [Sulfuricurvum sp.]
MTTIEWLMMGAFIAGLGLAGWKVYAFLPSTPLEDDDTTTQSTLTLEKIMVECSQDGMKEEELYEKMHQHPEFDPNHFWRFNQNRLRHLIEGYRLKEPNFRL